MEFYETSTEGALLLLVGWLVGKTLGTTATHRVQPDMLDHSPRLCHKGKINTTPQHTDPLINLVQVSK